MGRRSWLRCVALRSPPRDAFVNVEPTDRVLSRTIAVAVTALLLTGCGYLPAKIQLERIEIESDGKLLQVWLDECVPDLELDVDESHDEVALRASGSRASDTGCAANEMIGLAEPLGDRRLSFNGKAVEPVTTDFLPDYPD